MKKFTIQLETLKTTRFFIFTKTFLNDECPICFDNILPETRAKVGCNHSFCIDCIKEHIIYSENKKELTCPCCRQTITNMKLVNKTEMNHIKNLVNVPQKYNERERTSEIRLYERRQGRLIVTSTSDARI
jgi:hypothetical protein